MGYERFIDFSGTTGRYLISNRRISAKIEKIADRSSLQTAK